MTRWLRFSRGVGAGRVIHVLNADRVRRLEARVVSDPESPQGVRLVAILAFADDNEGKDYGLIYRTPAGLTLAQAAARALALLDLILAFLADPAPEALVMDVDGAIQTLP